jgi:hypothetical protein
MPVLISFSMCSRDSNVPPPRRENLSDQRSCSQPRYPTPHKYVSKRAFADPRCPCHDLAWKLPEMVQLIVGESRTVRADGEVVLVGDDDHEREQQPEQRHDDAEHRRGDLGVETLPRRGHEAADQHDGE